MTDVEELLEELAGAGAPRGAASVYEGAGARALQHRRNRRRVRVVSGLASVLAVVVIVVVVIAQSPTTQPGPARLGVGEGTTTTTIASATAAQLAAGHWSTLPAAPIAPRSAASVVWTGKELIVWGGDALQAGSSSRGVFGDGAAYDPATRAWRRLPGSPLGPRSGQIAVWTGSEVVLSGGWSSSVAGATGPVGAPTWVNDGAAYTPATNTWRTIADAPPTIVNGDIGVWTGDRVVVLAGNGAASYDPATNVWRSLPAAVPSPRLPGYQIVRSGWQVGAAAGSGRVFAWSQWEGQKTIGPGETLGTGGSDLFRYDESANRWTELAAGPNGILQPEEAFWTGDRLLVRGDMHVPGAGGPGPLPEVSAWYDPITGVATPLPPDALDAHESDAGQFSSAWTGDALLSLNGPGNGSPGAASVYDATRNTWQRLATAAFGCWSPPPPVWTGTSVLVYCARPYPSRPNPVAGLEYIPG